MTSTEILGNYIIANWDGWPLHVAIACLVMHPKITNIYPSFMLAMNIVFWPLREVWQHEDSFANIWTTHRMIEWMAPIAAACVMFYFVRGMRRVK